MGLAALTMLALVSFGLASPSPARAATTTSTTDITKCDYNTLSSAVANAASGDTLQFGCDGIIKFAATFTLDKTLTIDGNGHKVTLDGVGARRLFILQSGGNLTLDGVTIDHGSVGPGKSDEEGGSIYNAGGTLTIKNSTVRNSYANGASVLFSNHPGYGGAIYSTGSTGAVTVENSVFDKNLVDGGKYGGNGYGGAIVSNGGTLTITDSAFSGNMAHGHGLTKYGYGGAVFIENGTNVAITNSAFSENTTNTGGGVVNNGGAVTITNSTFRDNGANQGGAVYNSAGTVSITSSIFIGNVVNGRTPLLLEAGQDSYGGAISNTTNGILNVASSTFAGNIAIGGTGYKSLLRGGAAEGGAISNGGAAAITDSTFAYNLAYGGHANVPSPKYIKTIFGSIGNFNAFAGGAYGGAVSNHGTLSITNSTFDDNVAGASGVLDLPIPPATIGIQAGISFLVEAKFTGSVNLADLIDLNYTSNGYGGGVYNDHTTTITNSTFSDNRTVGGGGGGVVNNKDASMSIANSILVGNEAGAIGSGNCGGAITDGGYNLTERMVDCDFAARTDVRTTTTQLGSLSDGVGLTETLALLTGSVAIDQIPRGVNGCGTEVTTDQRGLARPQGAKCDIGAFEIDETAPTTTVSVSPKPNVNGMYFSDVTVTLKSEDNANGSGVKTTYYTVNQGATHTYTAPFLIHSVGEDIISYWSVDNQGNIGAMKTLTIKSDTPTPPHLAICLCGHWDGGRSDCLADSHRSIAVPAAPDGLWRRSQQCAH